MIISILALIASVTTSPTPTVPVIVPQVGTACSGTLGVSWDGDRHTGLQRSASAQLDMCLNSVLALRLSSAGLAFPGAADFTEQAAPSVSASGHATLYADSAHRLKVSFNGGGYGSLPLLTDAVTSFTGAAGTTATVLHGNAAGAPSFGAVTSSDVDNSVCANGGCAITSDVSLGSAAPTIKTPAASAKDLNLSPDGSVVATKTTVLNTSTCNTLFLKFGTTSSTTGICDNGGGTRPVWRSNGVDIFEASAAVGLNVKGRLTLASGSFLETPQKALVVTSTTSPTGSFNRITSSGSITWSPNGTATMNDGSVSRACNVNATGNITMTNSSTYSGTGCVLAPGDCVSFIFDGTSSKIRELTCSHNGGL